MHICSHASVTNFAFSLVYLNVQDGIKQTEVDAYVAQQFQQADTDKDGQVTFEDFCKYYQAMSISKTRLELRATMGMEAERAHLVLVVHVTHKSKIYKSVLCQSACFNSASYTYSVCLCRLPVVISPSRETFHHSFPFQWSFAH